LIAAVVLLGLASAGVGTITDGRSAPTAPAAPSPATSPLSDESYVVRTGDTLWTIARRLQPTGDVRPLVDRLADRAGGAGLQPGQRIDLDGLAG
jgi:hypothetical protein